VSKEPGALQNPYDNAKAESFTKTLKKEEVNASAYQDIADLRQRLCEFFASTSNQARLLSAPGYLSPVRFEQNLLT